MSHLPPWRPPTLLESLADLLTPLLVLVLIGAGTCAAVILWEWVRR